MGRYNRTVGRRRLLSLLNYASQDLIHVRGWLEAFILVS